MVWASQDNTPEQTRGTYGVPMAVREATLEQSVRVKVAARDDLRDQSDELA